MIKSIQPFQSEAVKNLENIFVDYSSDMTKIAEMVKGVQKNVVQLGAFNDCRGIFLCYHRTGDGFCSGLLTSPVR